MSTKKPSMRSFTKGLKPIVIDKYRDGHRIGVASPLATTKVTRKTTFFFDTEAKRRNFIFDGMSPSRSSSKHYDSLPGSIRGGLKDNY
jgi:hypothetical protein